MHPGKCIIHVRKLEFAESTWFAVQNAAESFGSFGVQFLDNN